MRAREQTPNSHNALAYALPGSEQTGLQARPSLRRRHRQGSVFVLLGVLSVVLSLSALAVLVIDVVLRGTPWLSMAFLTEFDSRFAERAGIKAALFGSLWLIGLTVMISLPTGVLAAVYLEEYAPRNRINAFIQVNITNLAGIPSVIYGLLGLQIFVRWMELGRSVLAGSLTMALLVLPIIIVASQEAIRAVPQSTRQASLALGATRWQTTRSHVLPSALPGIMTGNILAASRAIGETAPLITIGALTRVPFIPSGPMDHFTVLPIQIFNWTSRPQADFHNLAAAGIILLLIVLLSMNAVAILLRQRFRKKLRG